MFIPSVQIVWWQGFASIYEVRFFLYNHLRIVQYSQIDSIGVIVVIRRVSIGSNGMIGIPIENDVIPMVLLVNMDLKMVLLV